MAKQVHFTFDGVDYTLEFTRKSVEAIEKQGFSLADISDKPMNALPTLFAGAFIAHHKFIKRETVDRIFSKMTNRDELFHTLVDMYNEPIVTLMDEPEPDEGNISWAMNS